MTDNDVTVTVTIHGVTARLAAIADEMRAAVTDQQGQFDDVIARISTGVEELRTEIARLAAVNPQIDFTRANVLADALAGDNIPAVEVPPVETPV